MYIQNTSWQSAAQTFAQSSSAQDDKIPASKVKSIEAKVPVAVSLEHFSEKATLIFENLSVGLSVQEKNEAIETLNSIGKAAAFSSMNGFESQSERMVVSQYFENFGGVLSDEAIKKMIFSKLDNPNYKNRDFLENFAKALEEPLQSINIRV
jgi:hypothetical protein